MSSDAAELVSAAEKYVHLDRNMRQRKRQASSVHESVACTCTPASKGGFSCGPGSQCLNRLSHMECDPACCPCAAECANQVMQQRLAPKARRIHMGEKGWGIVADEDILPGTFVMEYIGEVIDLDEAERRAARYEEAGLQHTYVMALSADEVIDATSRGGTARFINHSCVPNCATEKWLVRGELCVGIFARAHIPAGAEVTYNYCLAWNGGKRIRCCCGAAACLGYIGAHARGFRESLEEAAAAGAGTVWRDQDDGFRYPITAALDTFESDDEAEAVADLTAGAEPAMMEVDTPEAAAEAGSLSAPATRHSRDNSSRARGVGKVVGMTRAKRGPGRPAGGRAKRLKVEAAAKDPPAPVADELLLDTEYVMGARSRQGQGGASSSVVAAEGGWEPGAAGKIRLMARLQAFQSLQSAQSGSASQSRGAGTEGCASFDRVQCTAGRASSLAAVDELLRVFEAVHKKLELHVDHAG